ncbi:Cthe_2314 family HEPN domain-containing protein [Pedobacter sp. R-06]|uniref:Cthe_2314 family HEPN domain-containing protein n=1 Tax=Pedobacter sp. R-06 TaxID=3404051 RepID=UPI003CE6C3A6
MNLDYLNNLFTRKLLSDYSTFLRTAHTIEGFLPGKNNFALLDGCKRYQSTIFRIQNTLTETTEQIDHIRIYMGRYPFKRYYFEKGISQLEYLQYHTEALFHKVHTIQEIMKLLINEVYQLDLPERNCSFSELAKKLEKKAAPMVIYDNYTQAFANLVSLRHVNTHGGTIGDKERDEINIYDGLTLYKFEAKGYPMNREARDLLPMRIIEYRIREYKKKRLKVVDQVIEENARLLKEFLSSLHPEYLRQVSLMQSK